MAPDSFDDVDIRFVEDEPEPARRAPSLRRRVTVALSAWILAAAVLAAGASALTDSSDGVAAAKSSGAKAVRGADGVFYKRDGHKCDRERFRGGSSTSSSGFSPSDF